jgi:hypothetical protein
LTVTYQAGRRIQATSTDFGTAGAGIPAVAGGWVELGRSTLGGTGTLDVSSLSDKRYYMILINKPSGAVATSLRLNSDTSTNYSRRYSLNGGTDGTNTGRTAMFGQNFYHGNFNEFNMGYIANISTKEKLGQLFTVSGETAGASNAPARMNIVSKWTNTSNAINRMTTDGTSLPSGSELVVLGWDPTDSHTTNFWEELASVEYSGGTALTSGTITAKKYLWVQAYLKIASGTVDSNLWRFNADTGNNYAARYSRDGATDGANASISHMNINFGAGTRNNQLINMFIINNSANEKLVTGSGISQGASGASTAPNRLEFSPKWANTSSQITSIQCTQGNALNFESGTIMKVWGSD